MPAFFALLANKITAYKLIRLYKDRPLVWDKHDTRIVCLVHLSKEADIRNQKAWETQFQWFQQKLEHLDNFFRPKIKML